MLKSEEDIKKFFICYYRLLTVSQVSLQEIENVIIDLESCREFKVDDGSVAFEALKLLKFVYSFLSKEVCFLLRSDYD